jgi:hypothetical protein
MYIIFGEHQATPLREKYTVLELDTVRFNDNPGTATAFAVVENIPIPDINRTEHLTKMHQDLMENYRKRDWNFCEQAIEQLQGSWNSELDTFYDTIRTRVEQYKENDPGEGWDPVIQK